MPVPPADANGRIQQLGRLPIDQLAPGTYELRAIAKQETNRSPVRRCSESSSNWAEPSRRHADPPCRHRRSASPRRLGHCHGAFPVPPAARADRSTPRRRPPSWSTSSSAIAGDVPSWISPPRTSRSTRTGSIRRSIRSPACRAAAGSESGWRGRPEVDHVGDDVTAGAGERRRNATGQTTRRSRSFSITLQRLVAAGAARHARLRPNDRQRRGARRGVRDGSRFPYHPALYERPHRHPQRGREGHALGNRLRRGQGERAEELQARRRELETQNATATSAAGGISGAAMARNSSEIGARGRLRLVQTELNMLRSFENLRSRSSRLRHSGALLGVVESLSMLPDGRPSCSSRRDCRSRRLAARLDAVIDAANRANVTTYAIDAHGLRTKPQRRR